MHKNPHIQVLREYDEDTANYLRLCLFDDKPEKIAKWHKLMEDPIFKHKFNMSLNEQRELAYSRIKISEINSSRQTRLSMSLRPSEMRKIA